MEVLPLTFFLCVWLYCLIAQIIPFHILWYLQGLPTFWICLRFVSLQVWVLVSNFWFAGDYICLIHCSVLISAYQFPYSFFSILNFLFSGRSFLLVNLTFMSFDLFVLVGYIWFLVPCVANSKVYQINSTLIFPWFIYMLEAPSVLITSILHLVYLFCVLL